LEPIVTDLSMSLHEQIVGHIDCIFWTQHGTIVYIDTMCS
jgi:hypothetical protein